MFHDKRFACLREAASAKAGHPGVAILPKKAGLLRFPRPPTAQAGNDNFLNRDLGQFLLLHLANESGIIEYCLLFQFL